MNEFVNSFREISFILLWQRHARNVIDLSAKQREKDPGRCERISCDKNRLLRNYVHNLQQTCLHVVFWHGSGISLITYFKDYSWQTFGPMQSQWIMDLVLPKRIKCIPTVWYLLQSALNPGHHLRIPNSVTHQFSAHTSLSIMYEMTSM